MADGQVFSRGDNMRAHKALGIDDFELRSLKGLNIKMATERYEELFKRVRRAAYKKLGAHHPDGSDPNPHEFDLFRDHWEAFRTLTLKELRSISMPVDKAQALLNAWSDEAEAETSPEA
jgi:hypothetical protein